MRTTLRCAALGALLATAACAPRIGRLERVMDNGEVLEPRSEAVVERARVEGEIQREALAAGALPAPPPECASAACTADALLREGDELVAAGRFDLGLDRYDRADVLRPGHPETTLRIATTLDKSLRPIEAVLRYRLFIHQLELERLRARGEVAANVAAAIAAAHERIIVLERR
jgi:hypothetical protein